MGRHVRGDTKEPTARPSPTQGVPSPWRHFTETAGRVLEAPVVCMSLVDAHHRLVTSSYGMSPLEALPLAWPFMSNVIGSCHPVLVAGGRAEGLTAYLGVRLVAWDGCVVGTLSVLDLGPRLWKGPEIAFLLDLSARVVRKLELRPDNAGRTPHQEGSICWAAAWRTPVARC